MILAVNNLTVTFHHDGESKVAVNNISFGISRGETLCLVGESGSGKSVTALSILKLLPANGQIDARSVVKLESQDCEETNLVRADELAMQSVRGARIAMIFQEPMTSLNPVFTVGEQIIEAIKLSSPAVDDDEARTRAIDALRDVYIDDPGRRVDEYPHRLSGGQRQRVMIAMAMACEPDLLIADEPTTALDVTVQAEILALMRELQQRSRMGILFITHDLGVVAKIADRVAVMQQGQLVEQGSRESVLYYPWHHYTQKLLASLPENIPRDIYTPQHKRERPGAEIPFLRTVNLQVQYPVRSGLMRRVTGGVNAVNGVDLGIAKGEIVALVGESGCGKTTLARALLKLQKIHAGRIVFKGEDISSVKGKALKTLRKRMQYIFQDPASSLNPRLTVATTLTEPMQAHGIGESHDQRIEMAAELLRDVQLHPEHLWRYPHQFSGGQRQRIGIARALSLNPEFIVCDEITSALDVSVQAGVLQLLLSLRRERNLSLLFITHDIGVVEFISDKTAVMHRGRIVEIGETAKVCGDPVTKYTRDLIAAVPRVRMAV